MCCSLLQVCSSVMHTHTRAHLHADVREGPHLISDVYVGVCVCICFCFRVFVKLCVRDFIKCQRCCIRRETTSSSTFSPFLFSLPSPRGGDTLGGGGSNLNLLRPHPHEGTPHRCLWGWCDWGVAGGGDLGGVRGGRSRSDRE